jgi:hypothetical protein
MLIHAGVDRLTAFTRRKVEENVGVPIRARRHTRVDIDEMTAGINEEARITWLII